MDFGLDLTQTWAGVLSLIIFIVSYYFIAREEAYHMNKAKPALLAGTIMFIVIGIYFVLNGLNTELIHLETQKLIVEIAEIFFFLLVAMTFIEVMVSRGVFEVLRRKLVTRGYSYKKMFWIIGFLAFFLSPVADNLTTALILATLISAISKNPKFLIPTAINIVVAANAGGAWSPFGDITTLMAWSSGKGEFIDFITIFPAAFIGWLVTATLLSFFVSKGKPRVDDRVVCCKMKPGGKQVIYLGLFTIFVSVLIHHYFNIPAMWGMMYGLALLQMLTYTDKRFHHRGFDIYKNIKKTELDTLLFFFGILSAIGALDFLGYLKYITSFYEYFGVINGNILVGITSAIVDNIPVMSAVLKSDLNMGIEGWLMLTLTVGIGGSLISFGSAAGVGVMSKLKGIYTFTSHIKYLPIILIGYFVSILVFYLQFSFIGKF